VYIFVPTVLSINSETYSSANFYADTASFIRMTTPKVPLGDISHKSVVKPWASDVKEAINKFAAGEPGDEQAAEQGLKLLACVFKSAVRDSHAAVHTDIGNAIRSNDWTLTAKHLEEYLDDLQTALRRIHKVGERSHKEGVPENLRESWRAIDEYASLLAEESITDLIELCDIENSEPRLENVLVDLRDMAIAQYKHRREQGFDSFARDGEQNEYLPHRWRVLKRYISSALYLTVEQKQTGTLARDAIGMVASAAAMLFAASAAVIITNQWAASLSSAFIAAMVISYVIKDRIKEHGKRHLGRQLKRFLADHVVRIIGSGGTEVGSAKESFHIQSTTDCADEVLKIRYADLNSHEAIEGRPENVLCYSKDIALSSDALQEQFAGALGLTDIIRLNFLPFMRRMDDAWEKYRYIHPTKRTICETKCARVYHVNVVLQLFNQDALIDRHRVRVVANKKGILRIEEIGPNQRTYQRDEPEESEAAGIRIFDD
jgi:hypothetical protein